MIPVNNIIHDKTQPPVFKSRFVPTKTLADGFQYAIKNPADEGRTFFKLINTILNDGKDDIYKIEHNKGNKLFDYYETNIEKNGEEIDRIPLSSNANSGNNIISALKYIISKYPDTHRPPEIQAAPYEKLDADEYGIVQKPLKKLAGLSQKYNSSIFSNIQDVVNEAMETLDKYVIKNLNETKDKIFK